MFHTGLILTPDEAARGKLSPGPWRMEKHDPLTLGKNPFYTVRDNQNHCLATIEPFDAAVTPENENNARLMGAAFDLLEACGMALPILRQAAENEERQQNSPNVFGNVALRRCCDALTRALGHKIPTKV